MVAVDDVLVDALSPEVLQNLVDAVDTVQDGLDEREKEQEEPQGGEKSSLAATLCRFMFLHPGERKMLFLTIHFFLQ